MFGQILFWKSFSVDGSIYCWLRNCTVVRELTRGSVMCRYLITNELIYDQINIRAIVCQMISALHMLMFFCIDLVPVIVTSHFFRSQNGVIQQCGRCFTELHSTEDRGQVCSTCRIRVCQKCRKNGKDETDWKCIVCYP